MSGVGDAAAAILRVQPQRGVFPVIGVLTGLTLHRGPDSVGPVTGITDITVDVSGQRYSCGCGGGLIAEISAGTAGTADTGQFYLGRQVKVELIGGNLVAAYTVNWVDYQIEYQLAVDPIVEEPPVEEPPVEEPPPPWTSSADAFNYWTTVKHKTSADMPAIYADCLEFLTDTRIPVGTVVGP